MKKKTGNQANDDSIYNFFPRISHGCVVVHKTQFKGTGSFIDHYTNIYFFIIACV